MLYRRLAILVSIITLVVLAVACGGAQKPAPTTAPVAVKAPVAAAPTPTTAPVAVAPTPTRAPAAVAPTPTTAPVAVAPTLTRAPAASTPAPTKAAEPAPSLSPSVAAKFSLKPWKVGQQAKYEGMSGEGAATSTYSIVGKDGDDWWLELKFEKPGQPWSIVKMLVGDFTKGGQTGVKRFVIQQQDEPAFEMPLSMMQQAANSAPQDNESKVNEGVIGTENKTVKAGTFTNTIHAKYTTDNSTTDGYFHGSVPILGTVYSTTTVQGQPPITMELVATKDSGATSEVTGPVQPFPGIPGQ